MIKIGGFEKLTFFATIKFPYSKFEKNLFFSLILAEMFHNLWVAWIRFYVNNHSRVIMKIESNPWYPRIYGTFKEEKEKREDFFRFLNIKI